MDNSIFVRDFLFYLENWENLTDPCQIATYPQIFGNKYITTRGIQKCQNVKIKIARHIALAQSRIAGSPLTIYMSIKEVYSSISWQREALKESNKNITDPIKLDKWEEVVSTLGWVMGLLEETEEVNPTK